MATGARRLRLLAALILALGLGASACVYLTAADPADGAAAYRITGGQVFETEPSTLQTERMGGQALVMTARFDRWFGSLWHGRRLAGTLAALSVVAALGCLYLAGLAAEDDAGDGPR